jgi:N-formylglutamate deformylase
MSPLIFHIPHASIIIPEDSGLSAEPNDIAEQIRVMTDHHTDVIYGACAGADDVVIIAPVSRIVVDVERFPDDENEPMSEQGMGAVYVRGHDGCVLRSQPIDRARLMEQYYWPHHRALEAATHDHLRKHDRAVIVDCHSFAEHARPHDTDQSLPRPEICIGTDAFHTTEAMAETLEQIFSAHGFSVARNKPYAGALVPLSVFGKDPRVLSVMIELRRDLYMNETTSALLNDMSRISASTADAIAALRKL